MSQESRHISETSSDVKVLELPSSGSRSGELLWNKASTATKPTVMFSSSFQTLRDMIVDAEISKKKLMKVKRLGEGAFAVVDKCIYRTSDGFERQVAVKRLKPDIFKSQLDLEDFVREAMLLKKLSHFNVVDFLGLGSDVEKASEADVPIRKDSVYIVTEYMDQGTLSSKIIKQMKSKHTVYTIQDGIQWLIHIARGVKYLHNSSPRVIHRDLKIENIMLTEDYEGKIIAKIGDFGLHALIPKKRTTNHQPSSEEDKEKTSKKFLKQAATFKKGKVVYDQSVFALSGRTGSLLYMAPEVLRSEAYNEKADVFSFAIVMYEVLQKCMLLAFISTSAIPSEVDQYIESVLAGFRPYLPPEWPREIGSLLNRCWADPIGQRPSMEEVHDELVRIQERGIFQEKVKTENPKNKCSCCRTQ